MISLLVFYKFQLTFSSISIYSDIFHIVQSGIERIPGVHTPFVNVGSWKSEFAAHEEDGDVCSINFLHSGKNKAWYGVPYTETTKFEKLIQMFAEEMGQTCKTFMRHKQLIIAPSVLRDHGIRFTRVRKQSRTFSV